MAERIRFAVTSFVMGVLSFVCTERRASRFYRHVPRGIGYYFGRVGTMFSAASDRMLSDEGLAACK